MPNKHSKLQYVSTRNGYFLQNKGNQQSETNNSNNQQLPKAAPVRGLPSLTVKDQVLIHEPSSTRGYNQRFLKINPNTRQGPQSLKPIIVVTPEIVLPVPDTTSDQNDEAQPFVPADPSSTRLLRIPRVLEQIEDFNKPRLKKLYE